ncbi:MAG: hypothetical protein OXN89_03085 [Bryobacterales bacterium]|nr:hypothetical protein [Bryobacterales bacterium]
MQNRGLDWLLGKHAIPAGGDQVRVDRAQTPQLSAELLEQAGTEVPHGPSSTSAY